MCFAILGILLSNHNLPASFLKFVKQQTARTGCLQRWRARGNDFRSGSVGGIYESNEMRGHGSGNNSETRKARPLLGPVKEQKPEGKARRADWPVQLEVVCVVLFWKEHCTYAVLLVTRFWRSKFNSGHSHVGDLDITKWANYGVECCGKLLVYDGSQ